MWWLLLLSHFRGDHHHLCSLRGWWLDLHTSFPVAHFLWNSNADPAAPRTARCVVPVCHSRSAPSSILYPLPAEPSQRQAWIDFVRGCPCGGACDWNPPSSEISLVCSLHFSVRCFRFQRPRGYSVGYSKHLRRESVPTLYPIEQQCSSVPKESFLDDTAERLVSGDISWPHSAEIAAHISWAIETEWCTYEEQHRGPFFIFISLHLFFFFNTWHCPWVRKKGGD